MVVFGAHQKRKMGAVIKARNAEKTASSRKVCINMQGVDPSAAIFHVWSVGPALR